MQAASDVLKELDAVRLSGASKLRPGDMVDLAGDKVADPQETDAFLGQGPLKVVELVEATPGRVRVQFEGYRCGFPAGHLLRLRVKSGRG